MKPATDVRAADVDRERVLAELQRHTSAGRLSMDEFSERAAAVYASRTMGELSALTADLPHEPNPPVAAPLRHFSWTAAVVVAFVVGYVGLVAAVHASPMLSGLGCSW